MQHLHFRFGPIHIKPGSNLILGGYATPAEKPAEDGYITRLAPNLKTASGAVPPTYKLHLHHGVFINMGSQDTSSRELPERFFATGEKGEKTIFSMPAPYGYLTKASDRWLINYMIHDLTNKPYTVYITYDVDFVAAELGGSAEEDEAGEARVDGRGERARVPRVRRAARRRHERQVSPSRTRRRTPIPTGGQLGNQWTLPYSGTLVSVAGHLHPGGLYDDLMVVQTGRQGHPHTGRPGAGGDVPSSVRIFRSTAHYFGGVERRRPGTSR